MAEQTFRLPDLGEGLAEAQLVRWHIVEGASVAVNTPLCDVETAKALVPLPSPWAGTVQRLHCRPGESVAVGGALVTIMTAVAGDVPQPGGVLVGYGPEPESAASGSRRRSRAGPPRAEAGGDLRAAPFVRQLAREKGVDLGRIQGTGPDGRITRADVEAAAGAIDAGASSTRPVEPSHGDQRVSVVGIRKAIARQMVRSVSTIPQFTEFALFDATALVAARQAARARGQAITPLAYFVRAVAKAVRQFPLINSSWDEARDEIVIRRRVNIGIAVNTPQGLLVPVLQDADGLEVGALAERATALVAGARAGSLGPAQMSGSTITITNVGASGPIETGTPIINPPEACVVGFGGIRLRALVVDGQVMARESAWISISVDHRIVDGALATEFLTALVRTLEASDA